MTIYTMMLDYAGGTYVAQTESDNEHDALNDWLAKLQSERIADDASEEVAQAFEAVQGDGLTSLNGLTNVWCATAAGARGLALVNVVATAS